MERYDCLVQGAVELDLTVELVDPEWSLRRVLAALRSKGVEASIR